MSQTLEWYYWKALKSPSKLSVAVLKKATVMEWYQYTGFIYVFNWRNFLKIKNCCISFTNNKHVLPLRRRWPRWLGFWWFYSGIRAVLRIGGGRIHIHIVSRVLNYHQMALNLTQQSLNCSGDVHFAEKWSITDPLDTGIPILCHCSIFSAPMDHCSKS